MSREKWRDAPSNAASACPLNPLLELAYSLDSNRYNGSAGMIVDYRFSRAYKHGQVELWGD